VPSDDAGYVEIKAIPATVVSAPVLLLDSVEVDGLKGGAAVLRQRVGTLKLQTEGGAGKLALLCDIVVKKNRVTTVTVSVVERPPRCQCRNRSPMSAPSSPLCVG